MRRPIGTTSRASWPGEAIRRRRWYTGAQAVEDRRAVGEVEEMPEEMGAIEEKEWTEEEVRAEDGGDRAAEVPSGGGVDAGGAGPWPWHRP